MNYYTKLINFLKENGINNEEMFNYIYKNTTLIDYTREEEREIKGLYPKYDNKNKLTGFDLYIDTRNDETILLSIRPYIKAICAYYALGTKYKPVIDVNAEALAIHFEKLYLKENPNSKSQEYLNKIYQSIREEQNNSKHKIALEAQEKIERSYSKEKLSFDDLLTKAKKLTRKYKSK